MRRASRLWRTRPRPRAERSCVITIRLPNIRPNENCVERITARTINVIRTMTAPVLLRESESMPARNEPIEPPASNPLPVVSATPKIRLRNALEQAKSSAAPVIFV